MSDTLYFNGPILTMAEPLYAQALVTEGAFIRYVGSLEEAECAAGPGARRVDLAGRALLPAFLDAHSHLAAMANGLLQAPLEDCADVCRVCQRMADFIRERKIPRGAWVKGKGYDQNTLAEGAPPDRWALDRTCPDHPVVIQHASGHMGVFNSLALERLGVTEDTTCPPGGFMARDGAGRLTGYMEETAFLSLLSQAPMEDPAQLLAAFSDAQDRYAAHGIATVQEGMLSAPLVPLYRELIRQDRLKLDVVGYADGGDPAAAGAFSDCRGAYRGHFKLGGYKIFLDGSPQGRTAWMRQPYVDEPDYRGYPTLTDDQVYERVCLAADHGMQLLAHCNGDAAAEQFLSAVEKSAAAGRKLDRPVMIHAQLLGLDQLERVKSLGVIPSFFVAHVYHWGEVHVENFGPSRAAEISPAGSALALDLPFTFHQDAPVIQPDMLETVWCAVNRRTKAGRLLGPNQRISALAALKAVTVNAARQYFEEDQKGSLVPGKRADLVILSGDPLAVDPAAIREIQVLETIKAGTTIYSNQEKKVP